MIVVLLDKNHQGALEAFEATLSGRARILRCIDDRPEDILVSLDGPASLATEFESCDFVKKVHRFDGPWGLVSRQIHPEDTIVNLGDAKIGGKELIVIAGPCSVESAEQLQSTANAVRDQGAIGLRGGAFKPRTSPYAFQGLGEKGLEHLSAAREAGGLPIVTEVMSPESVELVASHADMLQVGSRNIQNFPLLEAVGKSDKPVLLKRGMASTIDEFLAAAEYIYLMGNTNIVLCERGIRTFEPRLRNTMDISAIALLKRLTHLPVVADPSHGTGLSELVPDLARAAVAAGADGLLIEVHPNPAVAYSDGRQSLDFKEFGELMEGLAPIANAMGRPLAGTVKPL